MKLTWPKTFVNMKKNTQKGRGTLHLIQEKLTTWQVAASLQPRQTSAASQTPGVLSDEGCHHAHLTGRAHKQGRSSMHPYGSTVCDGRLRRFGGPFLQKVQITLDTGAGVNLIPHNLLPRSWEDHCLHDVTLTNHGDANDQRLQLMGSIELRVRFGHAVYQKKFYISKCLAVPVIICMAFKNRRVTSIRCMDQEVQFARVTCVHISSDGRKHTQTRGDPSRPRRTASGKPSEVHPTRWACQTTSPLNSPEEFIWHRSAIRT